MTSKSVRIVKPCDLCNGRGKILGPMIDKICPKCNGTGVVEVFGPMLIMSIAQDDNNNTMIVEFINYTSDDWINAVELMRDKKSVTMMVMKLKLLDMVKSTA